MVVGGEATGPIAVKLMDSVVEVVIGQMHGVKVCWKGVKGMVQVLNETDNLGKSNYIDLPEEFP